MHFLQSDEWARFQEAVGRETIRCGGATGIVHTLPLVGRYLYTPRFPEGGSASSDIRECVHIGKERGYGWIRIEPENDQILLELRKEYGPALVKAPHDMQPRENLVIDISKNEEEVLAEMKPKTRYNIRLAEKKGVKVFCTSEEKYQRQCLDLIETTARRQSILPHPRQYYETMLEALGGASASPLLFLFAAEYEGKVLAANLVIFSGDTATYLHGGTSDEYREVMAPVLLQWEQIKEAQRRGCTRYDFGGISTEQHSPWAGITRFKMGFSPKTSPTTYPGCFDIVISGRTYLLYRCLRVAQGVRSSIQKLFR